MNEICLSPSYFLPQTADKNKWGIYSLEFHLADREYLRQAF